MRRAEKLRSSRRYHAIWDSSPASAPPAHLHILTESCFLCGRALNLLPRNPMAWYNIRKSYEQCTNIGRKPGRAAIDSYENQRKKDVEHADC